MRGRKPKPLELRVLHGDAGQRALDQHPRPRRSAPRCPDFLTGDAELCWKRLARELFDAGLLTVVDHDALAAYCMAYARWRRAERNIAKTGDVLVTAPQTNEDGEKIGGGNFYQNPHLAVANRALEQMIKLEAEFGMTPSSRSRVRAEISAAKAERKPTRTPADNPATDDDDDPRAVLKIVNG